jgi:hypothetical protein
MPEVAVTADCGLLYHYTSEDGLLGIIESDNIRATHVRFLNDYTEFRQAFKEEYVGVLADAFRERLPEHLDDAARRIVEGILSKRNHSPILRIVDDPSSTYEAFVCSFTALPQSGGDPGDRLSQWRGYSHASQGFSLGFDKTLLEKQIQFDNPHAKAGLLECIYGDEEKVRFFQDMGRAASARFMELMLSNMPVPSTLRTAMPNPTEEYKKGCYYFLKSLSQATAEFHTKAAQIKNSGFREECEWRIVLQGRRDALSPVVKFRKGRFGHTPFIEIPLSLAKPETSSLRRIVVGPGTHKEDIKHSVQLLLQKHGVRIRQPDINEGVEVATSLIPYRSG